MGSRLGTNWSRLSRYNTKKSQRCSQGSYFENGPGLIAFTIAQALTCAIVLWIYFLAYNLKDKF